MDDEIENVNVNLKLNSISVWNLALHNNLFLPSEYKRKNSNKGIE